jgi:hypothetical protein
MGILIWLSSSILAGILGRMGGAGKPYKTWMRDWVIPFLFLLTISLKVNIDFRVWWIYLITYILMGFSLTTYWDWLFNNIDNLWFSGFVVGLSTIPCIFLGIKLYSILVRATLLAIIWGSLNKWLPKMWFKDRAVPEEFLRYVSVVLTIPLLIL